MKMRPVFVEFENGELVVHTGATMPARVLSNSTYAESVSYWQQGRPPLRASDGMSEYPDTMICQEESDRLDAEREEE